MMKLPACKVCGEKERGKYRCPVDDAPYCSVACFKAHKAGYCSSTNAYDPPPVTLLPPPETRKDDDDRPRKRLKNLKWPIEPDSALWDDPLSRHDVKPLRGFEYQALATSPKLRQLLASPTLVNTLTKLTALPHSSAPAALRVLLGLAPEPAPTFYRPSPSQKYSSGSRPSELGVMMAATRGRVGVGGDGGAGGARGRGRGRGRGGGVRTTAGGATSRIRLVESTPEERAEVDAFVECLLAVLDAERVQRGERSNMDT